MHITRTRDARRIFGGQAGLGSLSRGSENVRRIVSGKGSMFVIGPSTRRQRTAALVAPDVWRPMGDGFTFGGVRRATNWMVRQVRLFSAPAITSVVRPSLPFRPSRPVNSGFGTCNREQVFEQIPGRFAARSSSRRTHAQSCRSSSSGLGTAPPLTTCRCDSDSASLGWSMNTGWGFLCPL